MTGASRGIGAAIAIKFAQRGANVAINYVSSSTAADSVANEVRTHGVRALTVKADVSNQAEVGTMFEAVKREFGRLDIVVSNSGIEHFGVLGEVTGDDIDRIFAVNVKGQYFVAQEAYKYLEDFGRVMLTSSISAVKVRNRRSLCIDWQNMLLSSNSIFAGRPRTRGLRLVQGSHSRYGKMSCGRLWSSQYHRQCDCSGRSQN